MREIEYSDVLAINYLSIFQISFNFIICILYIKQMVQCNYMYVEKIKLIDLFLLNCVAQTEIGVCPLFSRLLFSTELLTLSLNYISTFSNYNLSIE